jgi:hypothetical protein
MRAMCCCRVCLGMVLDSSLCLSFFGSPCNDLERCMLHRLALLASLRSTVLVPCHGATSLLAGWCACQSQLWSLPQSNGCQHTSSGLRTTRATHRYVSHMCSLIPHVCIPGQRFEA